MGTGTQGGWGARLGVDLLRPTPTVGMDGRRGAGSASGLADEQ